MIYNITGNTTIDTINGTRTSTDEDVGDLIIMAVISIVLGLMILITVIGNYIYLILFANISHKTLLLIPYTLTTITIYEDDIVIENFSFV